jgi:tRNA-specific 2-thiouridylase
MKKVVVALSGGVDSAVSAAILQSQGMEVEGIFMKNWSPEEAQSLSDCPWEADQSDAEAVCQQLKIPFRSVNFEKEYREKVVSYFINEYSNGRTPNPDIMCNKEIKFSLFWEIAKKEGASLMATGHYAQLKETPKGKVIYRGEDPGKDQSYFLYQLDHDQISRTIFPIGAFPKREVRLKAVNYNLPNAKKKDSQGICFIGHLDLKRFLKSQIPIQTGLVKLLPPYQSGAGLGDRMASSVVVGSHQGSQFYTIGERAGECLDNKLYRSSRQNKDVAPVYVIGKDSRTNVLYVTDQKNDPHLLSSKVTIASWQTTGGVFTVADLQNMLAGGEIILAQNRYQQKQLAVVESIKEEEGNISFGFSKQSNLLGAVAPGQSLVLYLPDGLLLGGGVIFSASS